MKNNKFPVCSERNVFKMNNEHENNTKPADCAKKNGKNCAWNNNEKQENNQRQYATKPDSELRKYNGAGRDIWLGENVVIVTEVVRLDQNLNENIMSDYVFSPANIEDSKSLFLFVQQAVAGYVK